MTKSKTILSVVFCLWVVFLATAANAGNILLVVDDAGMWAGDSVVKVLAEELGHTVTVATPPVTISQAAGMDLILISSTNSSTLDDDFRTTSIPVLNWSPYDWEDMALLESGGMSSAPSESSLTITTPTHDMAAGLSGTVLVQSCCSDIDFAEPTSSAQIAAVRLGEDSSYSAIWGYEAGAEMAYGYPAPARRAGTFIYNDGPLLLTTAGRNLVKAAITWTMAPPDTGSPTPPVVIITNPSQDTTVNASSIMISFTVDGSPDSLSFDLVPGNNELIVTSTNGAGTGKDTVYVARGTPGVSDPTWPSGATLTASDIKPSSLKLAWSAASDDSAVAYYQVYVNGAKVLRLPPSPRTCTISGLLMNTTYAFSVEALDLRENVSIDGPIRHFTTSNELPADPATTAPALPKGEANVVAYASAFLYHGDDAVQTGVIESMMDSVRAVVIRGAVVKVNGDSLAGVTVGVLNHPELGSTVTRADGKFDLVVNGGGQLTLQYSAKEYLPAQRDVFTRWQEYSIMPTVTLIKLDTTVSTIALADTGVMAARASIVSDGDGSRQATLLVPAGTGVTFTLPNGSTINPDSLHIRATEYTVGDHGPAAMPGSLPGSSAYTYAVEFNVDEAAALGVSDVQFDQPIYSYVENFIGMPTGYPVPVGYYDKAAGHWVPSTDGRVIEISSITSGKANLIVDTTGTPATDGHLDSLGITNSERVRLANLYSASQTLWRVPIRHFSSYDYNYPYRLPDDAAPPKAEPPEKDEATGKCNTETGSIINCQNQALGETVQFPGLPTMNYRSDRVPARRWGRLEIQVTDAALPASVDSVRLEVKIAGRKFQFSYSPADNITQVFEWDGKDAYGRTLNGKQPYSYSIFYGYSTGGYSLPPALSWPAGVVSLNGAPASFAMAGAGAIVVPLRTTYDLSDTYTGYLGVEEINDLGPGWSLANHHTYDPTSGILHLGNGEDRGVESGLGAVYTVAGGGSDDDPDGKPATSALLGQISEMDVGPDGTVYLADRGEGLVWKIGRDGIIHAIASGQNWHDVKVAPDGSLYLADADHSRIWKYSTSGALTVFAGNGFAGFSGDGGPATSASLNHATNIDLGADGSVYIVDRSNFRIRKVATTGIIQTIAGTGSTSFNGDSLPATQTNMGPGSLAVMDDGTIYFSDPFTARIRKMDPSGLVTTVAGNGTSGTAGDGGPALGAQTIADRIEAVNSKAGGTLIYLSDEINNTIRVVDEKGNLYRFAGGGFNTETNGIPGTEANFEEARGTAVDPAGNFYVGRYAGEAVTARKIIGRLPDFSNRDIFIPDMSAGEIYQFSPAGRHLKTFNAFTGKKLLEFGYGASGRLTTVTDAYGNVTEIGRNPGGDATSLVNPYGRTLALDQDIDGNLASITLPSGETHAFAYNAAGLMDTYTTPRGFDHEFTYDTLGRLTRDDDPSGGYKTLAKTDTAGGWKTTLATAMGRSNVYELLPQIDRSTLQLNFDYAGLATVTNWVGNGSVVTTSPDGTQSTVLKGPDPILGLQAMRRSGGESLTPYGIFSEFASSQKAILADSTNPLSLFSFVDSTTVNGNLATTQYIDSLKLWISTSAEGRRDTTLVDTLGKIIERFVPGAATLFYEYDGHGRLSILTQGEGPDARETHFFYNDSGYLSKMKDPLNDSVRFEYDLAGRVVRQILAGGQEVNYAYDADGNIDTLSPPGKPDHVFGYTEIGLENHYDPPTLGAGTFDTHTSYNLDKQLLEVNRPDSRDIQYAYDSAGRVDSLYTPLGAYRFHYTIESGLLDFMSSPFGVENGFAYDGTMPISVSWSGPVTGAIAFGYDENHRLSGLTVDGTSTLEFGYDGDGLLLSAGTMGYTRDTHGRLSKTTLGVVVDSLSYNAFGELEKSASISDGDTVYQCRYDRDKLGRIKQKIETIAGTTHSYQYTYDRTGRLIESYLDSVIASTYAYDSNGNRRIRTHASTIDSGTYDDQDRMTRYGSSTFTYNHNGDLLKKISGSDTTRYNYDVFGNLLSVVLPGGDSVSFLVDGRNRRVVKKMNGAFVQGFLYQSQLNPAAIVDSSGTIMAQFVYGSRSNVPDQMIKNDTAYQFVCDQLGSPRLILNTVTGVVTQRIDYDEFGNVTYDSNPEFQPFGFAGGLYDASIAQTRFGARDYAALEGRWTTKDPVKFSGGNANLYVYISNDPINRIDPSGLRPLSKCEKKSLNPYISMEDLEYADLHDGEVPWYLMDGYTGITRGNDIYFRPGQYDPSTPAGLALLGHELVHVGQYKNGMNWISYLWSTKKGYYLSPFEQKAYETQDMIFKELTIENGGCNCQD
ncbi:MAG: hypothetical protein JWO30_1716 [Fibrobacteres bacterium]|nr:hypothetical protein [Fibrobacterota bacterium]